MSNALKFDLAQLNPTVGAVEANAALVRRAFLNGSDAGADLVITPELVLSGYPPEDLVLKEAFLVRIEAAVFDLVALTNSSETALLLATPWRRGGQVFNAALMIERGVIQQVFLKHHLPNYGVFDEMRVFAAGPLPEPYDFRGVRLGIMICEDMWHMDVAFHLKEQGAQVLVVPNGSPFEADKLTTRREYAAARVRETGLPLVYVNQVGGQDELVFDGASFALSGAGELMARLPLWEEARLSLDFDAGEFTPARIEADHDPLQDIYMAMVLGLRDYVGKNGFPGVILGLSGGIDSAISAAVAVDALGPDKVHCVMMPSPYTSQESLEDAAAVADFLGCACETITIEPVMQAYDVILAESFAGREKDITEENIQSRARGLLLMAMSNKFGHMLLTTGNKSEMSVGYATIYGDMCGGYSVIKDVYKTTVFALCRWRNDTTPAGVLGPQGRVMPDRVITKPPSAELRPDQKDEDSLPPYEALDDILSGIVEEERSLEEIVARGHDLETVRKVWRLVDRAEYKRRQAPPGVKISSRAFGRDRRYPITNGFTKLV